MRRKSENMPTARRRLTVSANYQPRELREARRIKAYLDQSGKIISRYIKDLIQRDLDEKGFMMDWETCDLDGFTYGDLFGNNDSLDGNIYE